MWAIIIVLKVIIKGLRYCLGVIYNVVKVVKVVDLLINYTNTAEQDNTVSWNKNKYNIY